MICGIKFFPRAHKFIKCLKYINFDVLIISFVNLALNLTGSRLLLSSALNIISLISELTKLELRTFLLLCLAYEYQQFFVCLGFNFILIIYENFLGPLICAS
jgi:hypothetical protein